mmetsp:Transcript_31055/g.96072  ORF Transcript_31055/g.96072 Transcript_31055/m.96072 type:complete len:219 (+) Transcript_31055:363-1019(+)
MSSDGEPHAVKIYAWGCLTHGRCGHGRLSAEEKTGKYPLPMSFDKQPLHCAAGRHHSLFVLSCGAVWACGEGQSEFGTLTQCAYSPVKSKTEDGLKVVEVSAGDNTSYAISERGEAYSWGQGRYGALGHDDDERNHTKPTRLVGFQTTPMRRLACGRWHCAALVGVNQIFLWGRNHCGQLGIGFISRACSTPVAIVLDSEQHSNLLARDVAAGATPPS